MEEDLIAFKNWLCERYELSIPNEIVREYLKGRDQKKKRCYSVCTFQTLHETCGLGNINCSSRSLNKNIAI